MRQPKHPMLVIAALSIGLAAIWTYGPATGPTNADAGNPPTECAYDSFIANPAQCPRQTVWVPELPVNTPIFLAYWGGAYCTDVGTFQTWCVEIKPDPTPTVDPGPAPDTIPANIPASVPANAPVPLFTG